LSEGRIWGYVQADGDVDEDEANEDEVDEVEAVDEAAGEVPEECGDPRSDLFSALSALSAR
jgi:hypothetical protein